MLIRFFDLRAGEGSVVAKAFGILFCIVSAHTMLETARDALFLSTLAPAKLNLVYIALAGVTFVAAFAGTALARRFGRRNALICSLVVAAYVTTLLHFFTPTPRVALVLYVFSGLVGAVLLPQFWLLSGQVFTVAQGRRLFGPIASGGVLGGVAGAGVAAAALIVLPVTALLPIAAAVFIATAFLMTTVANDDEVPPLPAEHMVASAADGGAAMRREPFLFRIAAMIALATAAVLTVDYFFKSTAARLVAPAHLATFFARYYAAMNGISLLVQLFFANRLVRRLGVVGAVCVMPLLLIGGGIGALVAGGALLVALSLKTIDGGLRHSLNRISTELLYLPLAAEARSRGKAFIDGVLGRLVQALTGGILYFLATRGLDRPRVLAAIIVALSAAWFATAVSLRAPYLDLFRRALVRGSLDVASTADDLDLPSAEALVEALASLDPAHVVSAMEVLEQKHRAKLIPALVLYRNEESVVIRALEIFGESARRDWIPMGERLLSDSREAVRIAVVRALAKLGETELLRRALTDGSATVIAHAAFHLAVRDTDGELMEHPLIAAMMSASGDAGAAGRRALLAAVADTEEPRAAGVVLALATQEAMFANLEAVENLAHAMARIKDPRFIPVCIARMGAHTGLEAICSALVEMGEPALFALENAMGNPETPRRVRTHLPRTISRFDSQRACDFLTRQLAVEADGLVRYKVLRALGQLVARQPVKVDRVRIETEALRNLKEYLRVFSLRVALSTPTPSRADVAVRLVESPTGQLLLGLLEDKVAQSLERAYRLLKIAYRHEDIHRVHIASQSADVRARANAGEFLDVLLAGREQAALRELFGVVIEDRDDVGRAHAARRYVPDAPVTDDQALQMLIDDPDETLAALAAQSALLLGDVRLRATVARAQSERPMLQTLNERLFGEPGLVAEAGRA